MTLEDLLFRLVPALERAKIPYMVTGSVASSAHGVPRSTRDLDVVISPTRTQLLDLLKEFPQDQYYADEQQALQALANRSQFNIIDFATGWKTDFIIAQDSAYGRSALTRRLRVDIGGISVSVASPEDVILAKLQWSKLSKSGRQLQDAAGVVVTQGEHLDRAYIEHWVRELHLEAEWLALTEIGS